MKISKFEIPGLKIFEPNIFEDERGYFYESYNKKFFDKEIQSNTLFVQDNQSYSKKGVIRGLHYQFYPYSQGKIIRVLKGKIFDVAIDLRINSPYYGKYQSVILSERNKKIFWIPKGFAHGFQALSKYCIVSYKVDEFYNAKSEISINPLDANININWPINPELLSKKDSEGINLKKFTKIISSI